MYLYMNTSNVYNYVENSPFTEPFITPILIVIFCGLTSSLCINRKKMAKFIFNQRLEINNVLPLTNNNNNVDNNSIHKIEIDITRLDNNRDAKLPSYNELFNKYSI